MQPICHSSVAKERSLRVTFEWNRMTKEYYVYIMTNKSRTLYTGVTGGLMRRVYEPKNKFVILSMSF